MFKKRFKLNSTEIKDVFIKNTPYKVLRGIFFDIKVYSFKYDNNTNLKITIIISSKNFKKAVVRNKIKRRLYAILENWIKENFNIKNTFIIFYIKKEILSISFLDLKKEVYNSLNNI